MKIEKDDLQIDYKKVYEIFMHHYDMCKYDPESILLRRISNQKLKSPLFVSWEITSHCNLFCKHCRAANNYSKSHSSNHSFSEYKNVIQKICNCEPYRLGITGGEPFLNPFLFKIIEECKTNGLQLILYTNATLIDDSKAKKLSELLDNYDIVHVSIDGGNEYCNDSQRGDGSFKRAIFGLENLSHYKINVRLNIVPTLLNWTSILELCDIAIKYKVKEFGASPLMTAGNASEVNLAPPDSIAMFQTEINVVEKLKGTGVKYIGGISGAIHNYLYFPSLELKQKIKRESASKKICDAGTRKVFIDSNGDLYPCSLFASKPEFSIGNVFDESIIELWNNPQLDCFRQGFETDVICKDCELLFLCNGGCPALTYLHTKKLVGVDPRCPKKNMI